MTVPDVLVLGGVPRVVDQTGTGYVAGLAEVRAHCGVAVSS